MQARLASRPVSPDATGQRPVRGFLFAIPATPGVWMGIVGLALFVVASALPWYVISAKFPFAGYPDYTTIIQFDGISGLYVDPELKSNLGLSPPSVAFPVAIVFAVTAFFKIRKLIRTTQHKMRAGTLFRSSLTILIPLTITLAAITQIPSIIPADAPQQVKDLGHSIAAQPFGGEDNFTFEPAPGFPQSGQLRWGFGPALWVMILAAVVMNLGSRLEMRAYRKAARQLVIEQAGR